MYEKKIVIIGGSIAGCTIAAMLQNLGLNVTILERSAGLIKQGTGVTLPFSIVNECIQFDLFDSSIPRFPIFSRAFLRKSSKSETEEAFWNQPLEVLTLNWMHIFENLRSRIKPQNYISKTEVIDIISTDDKYTIKTSTGINYEADFIIAADGISSYAREWLIPDVKPKYSGYIAWRGLVELAESDEKICDEHIPYYVFKNGHILLYSIPSLDYINSGKKIVNWVLYEPLNEEYLKDFLVDKMGKQHSNSLPGGSLTKHHLKHLEKLITNVLPSSCANLIKRTQEPFLQAVFDFQLPDYKNDKILFIGDAALTLRPHTASGVFKALKNGLDLGGLFKNNMTLNFVELGAQWKKMQKEFASEEVRKTVNMGLNLVTNTPEWQKMNQKTTELWWNKIMCGSNWYAIKQVDASIFKPTKESCSSKESDELISLHVAKL